MIAPAGGPPDPADSQQIAAPRSQATGAAEDLSLAICQVIMRYGRACTPLGGSTMCRRRRRTAALPLQMAESFALLLPLRPQEKGKARP